MKFLQKCRNELRTIYRCYCNELNAENLDTSWKSHPYAIAPFNSYGELAELLAKNVIYKHGGLLILNRPHGLKKEELITERGFWKKKLKLNISPFLQSVDKLSFTGALPHLKKKLKLSNLELLKAPDRHMSGISILSYGNSGLVPQRARRALFPPDLPKYTFLAVCGGIPTADEKSVKLGLTLLERKSTKKLIFVQNYSKRSVESGKVFPFIVNHKVRSVNDELKVSLIELETTKNKWNAVRAYCAMRLLSPALGDSIHGCYVQEINKTRIAVDPFSPAANKPYRIPKNVLDVLGLEFQMQSIIPLHIHLAKLNFLKYRSDGRTFTAKPPDHFSWTCEKLGLTIPEEYSDNRVSDKLIKLVAPDSDSVDERGAEWYSDDENENESYTPMASPEDKHAPSDTEDIQLDFDESRSSHTESEKKS